MRKAPSGRSRTRASLQCSTVLFGCSLPRMVRASGASIASFAGGRRSLRPRELTQRGLQQCRELGIVAEFFAGHVQCGFRVPRFVAEIDEGRMNIVVDGGSCRGSLLAG